MKQIEKNLKLTSGSILLRPYRLSGIDAVYEAVVESEAGLSPRMYWYHPDYSFMGAKDRIRFGFSTIIVCICSSEIPPLCSIQSTTSRRMCA